jgi:hypothetical protein
MDPRIALGEVVNCRIQELNGKFWLIAERTKYLDTGGMEMTHEVITTTPLSGKDVQGMYFD